MKTLNLYIEKYCGIFYIEETKRSEEYYKDIPAQVLWLAAKGFSRQVRPLFMRKLAKIKDFINDALIDFEKDFEKRWEDVTEWCYFSPGGEIFDRAPDGLGAYYGGIPNDVTSVEPMGDIWIRRAENGSRPKVLRRIAL